MQPITIPVQLDEDVESNVEPANTTWSELRHSRRRVEIDEERIMSSTQAGAHTLQKSLENLFVIGGGIIGLETGTVSCGAA